MFYLTTHSTHFYLLSYGDGQMMNDHKDDEKGNRLPPLQGLIFPFSNKVSFINISKLIFTRTLRSLY